jgi:multisubunit Na+/H+ antiporter MnhF subunit
MDDQAIAKGKSVWSIISFACPMCAVALAFTLGRSINNEDGAMRIVGIGGYLFLALAIFALIAAFVRKERMKWLTILPVVLLLALLGLGVSVP